MEVACAVVAESLAPVSLQNLPLPASVRPVRRASGFPPGAIVFLNPPTATDLPFGHFAVASPLLTAEMLTVLVRFARPANANVAPSTAAIATSVPTPNRVVRLRLPPA